MDFCLTAGAFEILLNNFGKFGGRHLIGRSLHQLARQVLPGSKEHPSMPGLLVPAGRRNTGSPSDKLSDTDRAAVTQTTDTRALAALAGV